MPKFQKRFPKNALNYFDPASDEEFKRRHPVGYVVLVFFGIAGLILPLVVFIIFTSIIYPAPNSGFYFLSIVGCFIFGTGIFNIVAAWIEQYLGHLVTFGCFLIGGILVAISCVIMYVPNVYSLFDHDVVSMYFATLLFLALPPIFYGMFRFAIDTWIKRKKIKKSIIKRMKKGKKNYWWYETIHREFNLGILYHLNKLMTVLYPVTLALALFFGWLRPVIPIVSVLLAIVSLDAAIMCFFSSLQDHLEEYGTALVLFRMSKNKRIDSIVLDFVIAAVPLLMGYAHVKLMLDMIF